MNSFFDENMIATVKEAFGNQKNNNFQMQYQVLKSMLNKISSRISKLVFDDNFSTKLWVDEILNKNNTLYV